MSNLSAWHESALQRLDAAGFAALAATLGQRCEAVYAKGHGDLPKWQAALTDLPEIPVASVDLQSAVATTGAAIDERALTAALMPLMPWRKGPFQLNNVLLDTEWRSDWKWQRLAPHINLQYKNVLDIGCGNGYYGWRMLGAGAASVTGIDPMLLFVMQFRAIHQLLNQPAAPLDVLPLGIDDIPEQCAAWDTVFSMGVLYHRRSPIDHLLKLRDCLKPGGELVLETLVIEGDAGDILLPAGGERGSDGDRYARMRNVWFLPATAELERWLQRCGFTNIRCVDESYTQLSEQRSTAFMPYQSLADFLDPDNRQLTVEGCPAPRRALLLASKPGSG